MYARGTHARAHIYAYAHTLHTRSDFGLVYLKLVESQRKLLSELSQYHYL